MLPSSSIWLVSAVTDASIESAESSSSSPFVFSPLEPRLLSDICRRNFSARRATSTSTTTTYSIWQRNTGKVMQRCSSQLDLKRFNGSLNRLMCCVPSVGSSPEQRKNRDSVLQVQNKIQLLHDPPKPVVSLHQSMDQRSWIYSLFKQGYFVSTGIEGITHLNSHWNPVYSWMLVCSSRGSGQTKDEEAGSSKTVQGEMPALLYSAGVCRATANTCVWFPQKTQSTYLWFLASPLALAQWSTQAT